MGLEPSEIAVCGSHWNRRADKDANYVAPKVFGRQGVGESAVPGDGINMHPWMHVERILDFRTESI